MHPFECRLSDEWFGTKFSTARALIAVSGGADSVALLCALTRVVSDAKLLAVAHFNHRWRGGESDKDQAFVRQLSDKLGLPFSSAVAQSNLNPSEERARDDRYAFLQSTAYKIGARSIVTAHTASDRIETTLHNLFRGTGVAGLRGFTKIRPIDEELVLVRPIRNQTRGQVMEYLHYASQDYREDSTNCDPSFKRNYLRNKLLPQIREQYGASVDSNILRLAENAAELDSMLEELAEQYWELVIAMRANEGIEPNGSPESQAIVFPCNSRIPVHWSVLQRALARQWTQLGWSVGKMDSKHWNLIRNAHQETAQSASGVWQHRSNLPQNLTLATKSGWVRVKS